MFTHSRRFIPSLLCTFLMLSSAARGLPSNPTIRSGFYPVLPPVEGRVSLAGASDTGDFAAGMVTIGNTRQMFTWSPAGGSQIVNLPAQHWIQQVTAVSADGSTVGGEVGMNSPFNGQAFRWSPTYGIQTLGRLSNDSSDESYVQSMNSDGSVIVGTSETPNGRRAFLWKQSQGMTNLGTLGSSNPFYDPWSHGAGVNEDGTVVVGTTTIVGMNTGQMARWTSSGGWQSLGSLPEEPRNAGGTSMTADGTTVVGYNQGKGFDALIWTQESGLRALPRLPGYSYNEADLISKDGSLIAGLVIDTEGHAAVWKKRGEAYEPQLANDYFTQNGLELGNWEIWSINSLSPDGRVLAGIARDEQGQQRGFVAVLPVPEPAIQLLVFVGITAAGLRKFRFC